MTPVDQTIVVGQSYRVGNCLAACVATFLDIPLERVPHFIEYDPEALASMDEPSTVWWMLTVGFMAGWSLWPVVLDSFDDADPDEVLFVMGMSPRGVCHQVLYRDGELCHDPHPSRAGLLDVREILAWRPRLHDHDPLSEARS